MYVFNKTILLKKYLGTALQSCTSYIYLLSFISYLVLSSCLDNGANQRDTTIYLELDGTGVTSVTLQVSVEDSSDEWNFALARNDSIVMEHTVTGKDTTVRDTGLEPGTEYDYLAYWLANGKIKDSSNAVIASTLDTTSHNFTWTIDTLGEYGSYLKDAWIVDENDIWVVGNIETDSGEYNAAHWDGNDWELLGIHSNTLDLRSIWYFDKNDIWVTDYCSPIHWDGDEWIYYHIQNMGLDACAGFGIWGTSSSNIYFVGYQGSIIHHDGQEFEKMESGTEVKLKNISGSGPDNIWVSGHDLDTGGDQVVLLHYDGMAWNKVIEQSVTTYLTPGQISGGIVGIYTDSADSVWVYTHLGFYSCPVTTTGEGNLIWDTSIDETAIEAFGGTSHNDLFSAGTFSIIWHYNGLTWHRYKEIPEIGTIYGMAAQSNMAVFVGYIYSPDRAFVIRGYR